MTHAHVPIDGYSKQTEEGTEASSQTNASDQRAQSGLVAEESLPFHYTYEVENTIIMQRFAWISQSKSNIIQRLALMSQTKSSITSEYCVGISYLKVCS